MLQVNDQNILLDIGGGTLEKLHQYIEYYQLTAIIISHLHQDHFLDLLPLHYAMMLDIISGKRSEALPIYLPFRASKELDYIQSKVGEEYHLQELTKETKLQVGELSFSFKETNHPKECYAVKVEQGEKNFGFTADTAWDEELISFLAGGDLLLAEASLLEEDKDKRNMGHLTVREAVDFGVQSKSKRLLLTHLGSYYQKEQIIKEVDYGKIDVQLSRVGETYYI